MSKWAAGILLSVVTLFSSSLPLRAATGSNRYQFKAIATKDALFSTFGNWPSINNSGDVAFNTVLTQTSNYAIYVGNGISTHEIYNAGPSGTIQNGPTINDSGWVAFGAYNGSTNSILISNGTTTHFVAPGIVVSPSLNNAGKVTFNAPVGSSREGVALWNNGNTTWLADATANFSGVSEPVVNNSDAVTFMGQDFNTVNTAIYRATTAGRTRVIGKGDLIRAGQTVTVVGNRPTIDDAGRIVSMMTDSGGVSGLYSFNADGSIQSITTNQGLFADFTSVYGTRPAIDNVSGLVFGAELDDGRMGIFDGPDPTNNKILATGDTLFGRTVDNIVLGYGGLNANGQIAFQVLFA